ncbi:MAG: zf-HC2 domain-containing protein [Polyangiaceae bacterium]|nr:zf-HC2 domain-containing protein [Polyangiaceae bacterium]
MSACREVSPYVEPYVDGELPASDCAKVEEHLQGCELCQGRVRLDEALRISVRRSVQESTVLSVAFEERVRASLAAERAREVEVERAPKSAPLGWRAVLPLAAAAAVAVGVGIWKNGGRTDVGARPISEAGSVNSPEALGAQDIAARVESQLDQLVENHARGSAPQFTQLAMLRQLEPEVGVPLRPLSLQDYGVRFLGGSMVPLKGRQTASFSYGSPDGHRLTVYVYDARRVPLGSALEARVVQRTPVYVGTRRGYSIAAVERRGVGYALAADMDDRESAELIVRSVH